MRTDFNIYNAIKEMKTVTDTEYRRGYISALEWVLNGDKVGNVAKPNACPQLCDVTALREYIRSCIDNFSRHNKDHPEDTTNSAFQFAFEGIMRKIDELCKD